MKKSVILIFLVLVLSASVRTYAVSLGVYTDGSAGRMFLPDGTWGRQVHENYSAGCGILLQKPLERVKNAGYRISFGFDRMFITRTTRLAADYNDMYRVNLANILTYSCYKWKKISVWVGPQTGLSFVSGRIYSAGSKHQRDLVFIPGVPPNTIALILVNDAMSRNRRFTDFILSFAPVIGVDINPDQLVTISADAGIRVGVHLKANNP
jgi:hypothetical protein